MAKWVITFFGSVLLRVCLPIYTLTLNIILLGVLSETKMLYHFNIYIFTNHLLLIILYKKLYDIHHFIINDIVIWWLLGIESMYIVKGGHENNSDSIGGGLGSLLLGFLTSV